MKKKKQLNELNSAVLEISQLQRTHAKHAFPCMAPRRVINRRRPGIFIPVEGVSQCAFYNVLQCVQQKLLDIYH